MGYSVSGKSSQSGLDGGNLNSGVSTGARYSPAKDYTLVILAAIGVVALLIYSKKGK